MNGIERTHRGAAGDTLSRLISGYGANPAVPDEMVDRNGVLRPAWRALVDYLDPLGPEEIATRFARGDQYLRDAGVFYRHYGKGQAPPRDWPLNHIPVIIPEAEFRVLEAGLIQRAELLETVVADIYGENTLVANGDLPGVLVGENPHWMRSMVGVKPASGHFLHFVAMELGRGPDGRWWVLGDRTEAPSGAGLALESRVASSKIFRSLFRNSNVHRLAGFFSAFKDALWKTHPHEHSRPAILTPGPYNENYFEQAYIARYLGLPLLRGEDLVVQGDHLAVRTIEGPQALGVLWRRLASDWCDPLELNERSRLGVPGLMNAVRAQGVSLVNALGAGILETQAMLAFLPALCEKLRDEDLIIPNVATWWCGQPDEFRHVRRHADRMMISPAMSNRMAIELESNCALAGQMRGNETRDLLDWLEQERSSLVGQELVTLSTTPAYVEGKLAPRPVSVRFFLARTAQGWQVMPGGFARVGANSDPSAIAMGRGGAVADVWVISDRPVHQVSLLHVPTHEFQRARPAVLPSRAADNLFWLGRYVERAEGMLRQLRAYHVRLSEFGGADVPLLEQMRAVFEANGVDITQTLPEAVASALQSAIFSASHVRDRFSTDGWSALLDLSGTANQLALTIEPGDDAARAFGVLIRKITGFSGLVHENMYQHTGWHFLALGRALERGMSRAWTMAEFTRDEAAEGALDLAVELGDSQMTYWSLHTVLTGRESVLDLLVLDPMNPRSLRHQVERIEEHASHLPHFEDVGQLSAIARAILTLRTALSTLTPREITPERLTDLGNEMASVSDLFSTTYFS